MSFASGVCSTHVDLIEKWRLRIFRLTSYFTLTNFFQFSHWIYVPFLNFCYYEGYNTSEFFSVIPSLLRKTFDKSFLFQLSDPKKAVFLNFRCTLLLQSGTYSIYFPNILFFVYFKTDYWDMSSFNLAMVTNSHNSSWIW